MCTISAKSFIICVSWSSSKFSIFSDELPGFSEITGLCRNLGIAFSITWLVLSNYKKTVPKSQFLINRASHLKLKLKNKQM